MLFRSPRRRGRGGAASGNTARRATDTTDSVSVAGINAKMKESADDSFGYTEDEIVSSDTIGMSYGSLFDATQTLVQKCGTHIYEVRVVSWYDNEMSYVSQLIRTLTYMGMLK